MDHFASAVADELRAGRLVIIRDQDRQRRRHALTALGFRTERKLDGTFTATACDAPRDDVLRKVLAPLTAAAADA